MANVWIYLPGVAQQPAKQVAGVGVKEGVDIPQELLDTMRRNGVCMDVHYTYTFDAKVTRGVAHHGFRVPSQTGESAATPGTWLQISLPDAFYVDLG